MTRHYYYIFIAWLLVLATSSCNSDNDILPGNAPTIEFDSPDGVYVVKVGHTLRISPFVGNAEGASYRWSIDDRTVGTSRDFEMEWPRLGSYYVMLTVSSPTGTARAEARVDVVETTPPVIDLTVTDAGVYVLPDEDYVIAPRYGYDDVEGFGVTWKVDGVEAGHERDFTFRRHDVGSYEVTVEAVNDDGHASRSLTVRVVESLPRSLSFLPPSLMQTSTDRYTFAGRPVVLEPVTDNIAPGAVFEWTVDGAKVDCSGRRLVFTPERPGDYTVRAAADGVQAEVRVVCVAATESSLMRRASASSSAYCNKVWEYVPAPGQFIGDDSSAGEMSADVTTHEQAAEWAAERLAARRFVSLGACCGYLIVGFDHSVAAGEATYDLGLFGNSFAESNEPGVVWVMQDVNGNGRPDDEWYELRGSDYDNAATMHGYAVTYYRPGGSGLDVQWTDNRGGTGLVNYLASHHQQPSYYPAWITASSYTLRGTRLPANGRYNSVTGQWATLPLGWGYADNNGSDSAKWGGINAIDGGQCAGLRIANAVMADGTPIRLAYIDFVMIQSGTMQQLGQLGEASTEVFSVADYSLLAK